MISKATLYRTSLALPALLAGQVGSASAQGLTVDFSWTVNYDFNQPNQQVGGYVGDTVTGVLYGLTAGGTNEVPTSLSVTFPGLSPTTLTDLVFVPSGTNTYSQGFSVDQNGNVAPSSQAIFTDTNWQVTFGPSSNSSVLINLLSLQDSGATLNVSNEGSSITYVTQNQPQPVPEPGSMALIGSAVAGITAARRRRRTRG